MNVKDERGKWVVLVGKGEGVELYCGAVKASGVSSPMCDCTHQDLQGV